MYEKKRPFVGQQPPLRHQGEKRRMFLFSFILNVQYFDLICVCVCEIEAGTRERPTRVIMPVRATVTMRIVVRQSQRRESDRRRHRPAAVNHRQRWPSENRIIGHNIIRPKVIRTMKTRG